ncbi:MAG: ATP-binding protein [Myxococcota bacterium]
MVERREDDDLAGIVGRLRATYIVALGLIALLSVAGHLLTQRGFDGQLEVAATVDLAGRQRMLSQRIALGAARCESTPEALVGRELPERIASWREAHHSLMEGPHRAFATGLSAPSRRELAAVAARFDALLDAPLQPGPLAEAGDAFLQRMDAAVHDFSAKADARVVTLRGVDALLAVATLLLLLFEAILVFRPLIRRLRSSLDRQGRLFEALRSSEARYARAVAGSRLGIWDWDGTTGTLHLSPLTREMLGIGASAPATWESLAVRLDDADAERLSAQVQSLSGAGVELEVHLDEPGTRAMLVRGRPDGQGSAAGTVLPAEASRRRALREHIREAQALAQDRVPPLEAATQELAHDLKNYLHVIRVGAELLEEVPDAREDASLVRQAADDAATLARRLMRLGSGASAHTLAPPTPLRELLTRLEPVLRPFFASSQRLSFEVDERLPPVAVDALELRRALINLVLNARDALGREGHVRIRAEAAATSGEVLISVADDGHGMSDEVLERAFEPGFTTKGDEGSGIGLASVREWAESSGASLHIDSTEGVGTEVRLTLRT